MGSDAYGSSPSVLRSILKPLLRMLPTHTRLSLIQHARWLKRKEEARRYLGDGKECACCGLNWCEFVPAGDPPRQGEQCLRCGAGKRQRLMAVYMTKELSGRNASLLHFAPEISLTRHILDIPGIEYMSIDLSPDLAIMQGDITDLPIPDGKYDFVICSHVLEHIPDDAKAMAEMSRVMKPGGVAYVMVPQDLERENTYEDDTVVSFEDRRREFGQYDHIRVYGRDFVSRLENAGFSVSDISTREIADEATCEKYGLGEDVIFLCTKPSS